MKALGVRAAAACENATTPREACRCRCGGAFHGAGRVGDATELLDNLPESDPHHPENRSPPPWSLMRRPRPRRARAAPADPRQLAMF